MSVTHGDNAARSARKINSILYLSNMDPSLAPSHGDNLERSLRKIHGIVSATAPTEWANCALSGGWSGTLQARTSGNRIEFLGKVSNPAPLTTTAEVVATLPSSVVNPAAGRTAFAPGGTAVNPACSVGVIVAANGQINAAAFNNNDNPTIVWFDDVSVPL